jgi:hypothetical protein
VSPNGRLFTTGVPPPYDGFLIFACPKKGTERKGTPDSAPRMGNSHAGFPRLALVSAGPRKGHPWPWPGRAVSLPRPFGRVLRLHASLGLSKGIPKQDKCTLSMTFGSL